MVVLHRRIQIFFNDGRQTMNFVDEEHIAFIQIGQQTRNVGRLIEHRAGGRLDSASHLVCDNVRERRFSQAGRAGKKHVVQALFALRCSRHKDSQVVLDALLPHELVEMFWSQGFFDVFVPADHGRAKRVGLFDHDVLNDLGCHYTGPIIRQVLTGSVPAQVDNVEHML